MMIDQCRRHRWPLHGLQKRRYTTGRFDVPKNNYHQSQYLSLENFSLQTSRVSHKTWWQSSLQRARKQKFQGKDCSYSLNDPRRLNDRAFENWLPSQPNPTEPNRTENFTINSLTLLFGQTLCISQRILVPTHLILSKRLNYVYLWFLLTKFRDKPKNHYKIWQRQLAVFTNKREINDRNTNIFHIRIFKGTSSGKANNETVISSKSLRLKTIVTVDKLILLLWIRFVFCITYED